MEWKAASYLPGTHPRHLYSLLIRVSAHLQGSVVDLSQTQSPLGRLLARHRVQQLREGRRARADGRQELQKVKPHRAGRRVLANLVEGKLKRSHHLQLPVVTL